MWALIQGNWRRSYTGTGQFFPNNVVLFNSQKEAESVLLKYYESHGADWYIIPVTDSVKENFIE